MDGSIVQWYGFRAGSRCGYCKSDSSKVNHGMWAHQLSCQTYEELLDRGWRRSGMYCYKPLMNQTCCPQYAIRCDVNKIKLSKSQKKVIKRLNKFLITGEKPAHSDETNNNSKTTDGCNIEYVDTVHLLNEGKSNIHSEVKINHKLVSKTDTKKSHSDNKVHEKIIYETETKLTYKLAASNDIPSSSKEKKIEGSHPIHPSSKEKTVKGADPNKPRCRKAKEIRMEKKMMKLSKNSEEMFDSSLIKNKNVCSEKSIEDLMVELPSEICHKLETCLVSVNDKEKFEVSFGAEYELFSKYQQVIHGDSKDDLNERRFRRFLVDGPLQHVHPRENNEVPSIGFGAFHQQYLLDGKLIAVGVLDVLPHCVSSVYFFYDPDYSFLSLGTYSALQEIYFIRWLNRECSQIKYYYMGYYIASCPKMNYKGQYHPSYLLCPETYIWQPIEMCIPKFSVNEYSRLEEDGENPPPSPDLNSVLILHNAQIMMYKTYMDSIHSRKRQVHEIEIQEYVTLVGNSCKNILLYRS